MYASEPEVCAISNSATVVQLRTRVFLEGVEWRTSMSGLGWLVWTQRVTGGKHAHPFAPECGTHPDMKLSLSHTIR